MLCAYTRLYDSKGAKLDDDHKSLRRFDYSRPTTLTFECLTDLDIRTKLSNTCSSLTK